MKQLFFLLLIGLVGQTAFARRAPVQLMPPDRSGASQEPTAIQHTQDRLQKSPYDRPMGQIGVELGVTGRQQSTDSDVLGMQALLGGRAFLWLPVYNRFTIKPSLGYFYKREALGSVNVSQTHLEAGMGLLLTAIDTEDLKWHLGLSNRVTRATSTASIYTSSSSSPADVFFRSGPTTGVLIRLGGKMHLAADLEYTWTYEKPTRGFLGLTSGLAFEL